jgi:hypothetical protein
MFSEIFSPNDGCDFKVLHVARTRVAAHPCSALSHHECCEEETSETIIAWGC